MIDATTIRHPDAYAGTLMNDAESLTARIRRGDDDAFRLIFQQHHRFIFRFIFGMVGDRALAEELTQETFMGAYRNRGTLRDEVKPSTYANIGNIRGPIDVTTATGNLEINQAESDVRVVSINGKTNIRCVAGRVEVRDTSGVVTLAGIADDVDVTTSNGRATFVGVVYAGRRYRLKTLSGAVHMAVPDEAASFTATLSSYSGSVETDFDLKGNSLPRSAGGKRRIVGTYGDGRSRVEMDSFNGRVRLSKIAPNAVEKCER